MLNATIMDLSGFYIYVSTNCWFSTFMCVSHVTSYTLHIASHSVHLAPTVGFELATLRVILTLLIPAILVLSKLGGLNSTCLTFLPPGKIPERDVKPKSPVNLMGNLP